MHELFLKSHEFLEGISYGYKYIQLNWELRGCSETQEGFRARKHMETQRFHGVVRVAFQEASCLVGRR